MTRSRWPRDWKRSWVRNKRGLSRVIPAIGTSCPSLTVLSQWVLTGDTEGKMDDLESSIEPFSETSPRFPQVVKALSDLRTDIVNTRHLIPNDGERYRNGEPIATGFVASTVHEVVSKRCCNKQ